MKTILVVFMSFILMFVGCEKDPVNPPDPPVPGSISIKFKVVDSQLFFAKINVPALDITNRVMSLEDESDLTTRVVSLGFIYEDFYNTVQVVKVEVILDPNGDGKAPYETFELEKNILIDQDKTVVFSQ